MDVVLSAVSFRDRPLSTASLGPMAYYVVTVPDEVEVSLMMGIVVIMQVSWCCLRRSLRCFASTSS